MGGRGERDVAKLKQVTDLRGGCAGKGSGDYCQHCSAPDRQIDHSEPLLSLPVSTHVQISVLYSGTGTKFPWVISGYKFVPSRQLPVHKMSVPPPLFPFDERWRKAEDTYCGQSLGQTTVIIQKRAQRMYISKISTEDSISMTSLNLSLIGLHVVFTAAMQDTREYFNFI